MRSNRVPFSDIAKLITETKVRDSEGYETITETETEVFCSIVDGVAHTEFYEAMKADMRLSITAEIWQDDWSGQKLFKHNSIRYNIIRTYPSGHGTLYLSLQEVER